MPVKRAALASLLLVAALALPVPALAGWGIVDFEIGAKGGAGGTLWTEPSRLPLYLGGQDWAFGAQRGGWSGGAGLYAQLRVLKCLGLEADFLVEQALIRETPLEGYSWKLTAKSVSLHIPILLQGILPLPGIRIGLGIGPEFVVPVQSKAEQSNPPLNYTGYPFKVEAQKATFLTIGLNLTPTIGHLSIPVDLRASYNLSQSKNFEGRVTVNKNTQGQKDVSKGFTIKYGDTWDFRLLVGLGYAF
jgi:hypothetical protein